MKKSEIKTAAEAIASVDHEWKKEQQAALLRHVMGEYGVEEGIADEVTQCCLDNPEILNASQMKQKLEKANVLEAKAKAEAKDVKSMMSRYNLSE